MSTMTREDLPKRTVKLTITVTSEELQPALVEAAARISEHVTIAGFRPGKASYEAVKAHVGEMKIMEEALETVVRKTLGGAIADEQIETVGSPSINVEKMAPGNDLVYTAQLALMPSVEKLADFTKFSVKAKDRSMKDEDVNAALFELQKTQRKEVREKKEMAAAKDHKAVVDLTMKKGGVIVEGGTAKNYQVYLAEPHYIPGFADELVGMKEQETKIFSLPFPKEHYQKHLAGENVEFEVTLNELYHLEAPALDDAFASSIGQKDLEGLKAVLKKNMSEEKTHEASMQEEREMLSLVAKESRFDEIPDLLVNQEIDKMVHELEHAIEEKGGKFDDYLASMKKTLAQLKLDLTPQAIERIKVTLVIPALGKQLEITVTAEELDAALDELAEQYQEKESKDRIYSPEYREYMQIALKNKKVVERLREGMVK